MSVYKICIDPGHGGKDPGAVGPTGLQEAEVALDLSDRLCDRLGDLGIDTLMTRLANEFIELADRCEIANNWDADYFVSVHLNSNGSTAVGIETLYKSDVGMGLAAPVQEAMVDATGDTDRGLKYRDDLYVLNGTNMPAILVEVGFISHPKTEDKFRTDEYKDIITEAIVSGIASYLKLDEPSAPVPIPPDEMATVTITIDAPSNVKIDIINLSANKT